jgi:hypothetical protein
MISSKEALDGTMSSGVLTTMKCAEETAQTIGWREMLRTTTSKVRKRTISWMTAGCGGADYGDGRPGGADVCVVEIETRVRCEN